MRRTVHILLITALLCGSAAYGSKKPRASTVPASHKRAAHAAKRVPVREKAHPATSHRHFRLRHAIKAVPATRPDRTTETGAASDQAPVVESASLTKTRLVMPPPLRGSYESLVRQNEKSEADGLERIEDDEDLANRIAGKMLVPVPVSSALAINGNLPENRRYCRPWTANFLSDLARAHVARFHTPIQVNSAVRTVAYQKQLARINGNAAAAEGDIASPHLTGATIDIAKQGLTRQEIAWMRARLLPLQDAGKIDVEEEFQQSCFHITVYKSYVPPRPARATTEQATAAPPPQGRRVNAKPRQRNPEQPRPQRSEPARRSSPSAPQNETPVEG